MGLLKESHLNHQGTLAFKWVYWNMLMPGRPLPLSTAMSLSGKQTELIDAK
jgi:sulfide:quinone oxidoreductase